MSESSNSSQSFWNRRSEMYTLLQDSSDDDVSSTSRLAGVIPAIVQQQQDFIQRQIPTPPTWGGGSKYGRAPNLRDHVSSHNKLIIDYFAARPVFDLVKFRRRYRMRQNLFLKIYNAIHERNPFFHQKYDALRKPGPSGMIKVTAALRILSYGCSADSLDAELYISEQTALNSLKEFCQTIVDVFESEYLRAPTPEDVERLITKGAQRGFPGMLGSIDCMHWVWKNCPTADHGAHMGGHHKKATVILEAVADHELWIWHAFFGMAGSCNDLNVLENSHLFDDLVDGRAPPCNFEINGHHYDMGYFLSDGIYPRWATLIQSVKNPGPRKLKLFAQRHEAVRKDVERAFGVLQSRFAMVQRPARCWDRRQLGLFMKTCLILHNMIIEDERDVVLEPWRPPSDEVPIPVDVEMQPNNVEIITERLSKTLALRSQPAHERLKADLVEHIWNRHGGDY